MDLAELIYGKLDYDYLVEQVQGKDRNAYYFFDRNRSSCATKQQFCSNLGLVLISEIMIQLVRKNGKLVVSTFRSTLEAEQIDSILCNDNYSIIVMLSDKDIV